jgi:hypothetical protein
MVHQDFVYSFNMKEILLFSDPEQKALEGSNLSPFLKHFSLELMITHWYETAHIDYKTSHKGACRIAMGQAIKELDIRSWERFETVKSFLNRVIRIYDPEIGRNASQMVYQHMADTGLPASFFPKRWKHLKKIDA